LAGVAKVLEDAARSNQREPIDAIMPTFIDKWISYKELLNVFRGEEEKEQVRADEGQWKHMKERLRSAAEDMDISLLDELAEELENYAVSEENAEECQKIKDAILRFDVEYLMTI
jgi:ATP:corrinoid adenosyltransferase